MITCAKCGAMNHDDTVKCAACGAYYNPPSPPPPPAYSPYTPPTYSAPTPPPTYPTYTTPPTYTTYTPPIYTHHHVLENQGHDLALASLIIGIVACVCMGWGWIHSILAIVLGCAAKSKGYRGEMATAGIVLGGISVVLFIFSIFFIFSSTSMFYYYYW